MCHFHHAYDACDASYGFDIYHCQSRYTLSEWGGSRHRRGKHKPVADSASAEVSSDADTDDEKDLAVKMLNHQPAKQSAKGYDPNR